MQRRPRPPKGESMRPITPREDCLLAVLLLTISAVLLVGALAYSEEFKEALKAAFQAFFQVLAWIGGSNVA